MELVLLLLLLLRDRTVLYVMENESDGKKTNDHGAPYLV